MKPFPQEKIEVSSKVTLRHRLDGVKRSLRPYHSKPTCEADSPSQHQHLDDVAIMSRYGSSQIVRTGSRSFDGRPLV